MQGPAVYWVSCRCTCFWNKYYKKHCVCLHIWLRCRQSANCCSRCVVEYPWHYMSRQPDGVCGWWWLLQGTKSMHPERETWNPNLVWFMCCMFQQHDHGLQVRNTVCWGWEVYKLTRFSNINQCINTLFDRLRCLFSSCDGFEAFCLCVMDIAWPSAHVVFGVPIGSLYSQHCSTTSRQT